MAFKDVSMDWAPTGRSAFFEDEMVMSDEPFPDLFDFGLESAAAASSLDDPYMSYGDATYYASSAAPFQPETGDADASLTASVSDDPVMDVSAPPSPVAPVVDAERSVGGWKKRPVKLNLQSREQLTPTIAGEVRVRQLGDYFIDGLRGDFALIFSKITSHGAAAGIDADFLANVAALVAGAFRADYGATVHEPLVLLGRVAGLPTLVHAVVSAGVPDGGYAVPPGLPRGTLTVAQARSFRLPAKCFRVFDYLCSDSQRISRCQPVFDALVEHYHCVPSDTLVAYIASSLGSALPSVRTLVTNVLVRARSGTPADLPAFLSLVMSLFHVASCHCDMAAWTTVYSFLTSTERLELLRTSFVAALSANTEGKSTLARKIRSEATPDARAAFLRELKRVHLLSAIHRSLLDSQDPVKSTRPRVLQPSKIFCLPAPGVSTRASASATLLRKRASPVFAAEAISHPSQRTSTQAYRKSTSDVVTLRRVVKSLLQEEEQLQ